jgi:hypothetical protein
MINTHRLDELRAEFELIPRPKKAAELVGVAFETFDGVKIPVHGIPIPLRLGPLKRYWERRTRRRLVELGAWQWLQPEHRGEASQLVKLRNWLGLDKMDHATFCSQLTDACAKLIENHPKLERYIRGQIAEAEFGFLPAAPAGEYVVGSFEKFQSNLLVAALTRDVELAEFVATAALQVAARIVHDTLGGDASRTCQFDANLMLPLPDEAALAGFPGPGAQAAAALWSDCVDVPHQYFGVVLSVGAPKYLGFWIPDVRPKGQTLPGAPSAAKLKRTQAIHLDDLPEMPIDNPVTLGKWAHYLRGSDPGGFSGSMFVSMPVAAEMPTGDTRVVGVVNVNIHDDRAWHRAYSPAWLDRAGKLASHHVVTAWHAFWLADTLRRQRSTSLTLLNPRAQLLPPVFVTRMLAVDNTPKLAQKDE